MSQGKFDYICMRVHNWQMYYWNIIQPIMCINISIVYLNILQYFLVIQSMNIAWKPYKNHFNHYIYFVYDTMNVNLIFYEKIILQLIDCFDKKYCKIIMSIPCIIFLRIRILFLSQIGFVNIPCFATTSFPLLITRW